jgi:hypothetical protein
MSVIGIRLISFNGSREKGMSSGQIKVNSVPRITNVREPTIPVMDKKALAVDFEFVTDYDPKIGEITLTGEVYYATDKGQEIAKKWAAKKELPEPMRVDVLNHLFRACLLKIANLADDLQLPPPMAIPRVKPKPEPKSDSKAA